MVGRGSIVCACLIALGLPGCTPNHGTELKFEGSQLFHTSAVTREEADKLGNYLVESKFFGAKPITAQLNKIGHTYEFRLVVQPGVAQDAFSIQRFRGMGRTLSREVFDGQRVVVHLCDHNLKTLEVADPAADEERRP